MTGSKILIVDDEPDYRRILKDSLVRSGFRVFDVEDGETALKLARTILPDLLLLDLYLPNISGFEVCDRLKQDKATERIPVLVMTAFDDPKKDVACLEHGADGYLIKPIDEERLLAYITTILRRVRPVTKSESVVQPLVVEEGALQLDYSNKVVRFEGAQWTDFAPKEFEIFWQLVINRPNSIPREKLYQIVWREEKVNGNFKTVDVHIHRLRDKLVPKLAKRIRYITGRGYCFSE